ncbi:hypothetical protein A2U01_0066475, partial [Trifolium medium]|nr:hypothetical protein [Trifolium medium]
TVVDGITIDLKAMWRIVEYTMKSRLWKSEIALKYLQAALGARRAQILAWPLFWVRRALILVSELPAAPGASPWARGAPMSLADL